jgi:hypothetical protein
LLWETPSARSSQHRAGSGVDHDFVPTAIGKKRHQPSGKIADGGLAAPVQFFRFLFPAMIIILIILQTGCALCEKRLKRSFGVMLLSTYLLVTCIGYV